MDQKIKELEERINILEKTINNLIKIKPKLYLVNSSVTSFIEDMCIISDSEQTRIKCSKLYEAYRQFCKDKDFTAVNIKNFTRILEQNRIAVKKYAKLNNKTENCYCKIDLK